MKKKEIFNVCFCAIMVALAVVFDFLFKFFNNTFLRVFFVKGGGVSLAMLPLVVASIVCNWKYGIITGVAFGLINLMYDGYTYSFAVVIFDYIVAFGCVGIAGIFRNKILQNKKIYFLIAFLLTMAARLASHVLSGIINAHNWEIDTMLAEQGKVGFIYVLNYCIIYNAGYVVPSLMLCVLIGYLIYKPVFITFNPYNEFKKAN